MSGHAFPGRGLLAGVVLTLATAPAAHAQPRIELAAGAGTASALGQPGPDRRLGPTVMGAVQVSRAGLPVGLRLEAGYASQDLRVRSGGLLTGDVQTVHAAAALRVGPRSAHGALAPYAIAGAALLRHSIRTELSQSSATVPDGRFAATTSEVVPGALLGGGLDWRLAGVRGFAEVRWMRSGTTGGHTSTLPLIIGARLPLRD